MFLRSIAWLVLCLTGSVGFADDGTRSSSKLGGMKASEAQSWWAFQPLPAVEPETRSERIDALIHQALQTRDLDPHPPADARTLRRRVSYGLTGLPPHPDETRPFATLVEELLASPQYGVHWGRRWLDVVRYADTAGEDTDRPLMDIWRYRNWVFDAFNRDMPFDEFTRWQLAGDLINVEADYPEFRDGLVATGYLAVARRFGQKKDEDQHLMYEDVINNVGEAFLGLTLGCARCHDHKYDPVTAEDYYALYGIFSSSRFSFPGSEEDGEPEDLVPILRSDQIEELLKPWQDELDQIAAQKADMQTRVINGQSKIHELSEQHARTLFESVVGEGETVRMKGPALEKVMVRKGEVLRLTVDPNGTVRDDSTLVEWVIEHGDTRWDVTDLVQTLTTANPQLEDGEARWYFTAEQNGPRMLDQTVESIDGRDELAMWSLNNQEAVFVNRSDEEVQVWTALRAQSLFMLPGKNGAVAIAWVSPIEGAVRMSGMIQDAERSTRKGVHFKLEHLADPGFADAYGDIGGVNKPSPPKPVVPTAFAVVDADPAHARVHLRGEPELLGEEVPRRWLTVFGSEPVPPGAGSGRRELGEWIVRHPLFARVMVNRIWQGHFGEGLVRSPNDFGTRGEKPTHPELLDWLAAQFVASGYSVKAMHRLILGSQAYQRSSAHDAALKEADPENHWLAQFSRRRLSAEELRDSLLIHSGTLDLEASTAHPFPAVDAWEFTQHKPFVGIYESDKRSAYLMVQRQRAHPFLALFDGADPNMSTAEREVTTVPSQALYFLNDPFFHEQARLFVESLQGDSRERLVSAFQKAFQRTPTTAELVNAARFLRDYPGSTGEKWAAFGRIILASNEILYLD